MPASAEQQQAAQRAYYARTAEQYDEVHWNEVDEHQFALAILSGLIELLGVKTVLDIGSGTGRGLLKLKERHPGLTVVGIEPSPELREIGYGKGLSREELIDGDAQQLAMPDGAFDIVMETAALHHIPRPRLAVAEMLRVAHTGIFISDANNYGQGSAPARLVKNVVRRLGLWRAFDYVRTGGRGYMESEGDGIFYSYSVFNDYRFIKARCRSVHVMNTSDAGLNPLTSASNVALLALK
jgi:ubiquinone/menaquinone biosynthesis C-methylase UbiE